MGETTKGYVGHIPQEIQSTKETFERRDRKSATTIKVCSSFFFSKNSFHPLGTCRIQ